MEPAVVIQCAWRRCQARRRVRQLRSLRRDELAEEEWGYRERCAVSIQCAARRWRSRRVARAAREERRAAVSATLHKEVHYAALVLQRFCRRVCTAPDVRRRRRLHRERELMEARMLAEDAAAHIQAMWRGHKGRTEVRDFCSRKEERKVVLIQGWWRVAVRRKRFREEKEKVRKNEAAVMLQSWIRRGHSQKKYRTLSRERKQRDQEAVRAESAASIQGMVRARSAEKQVDRLREERRREWDRELQLSEFIAAVELRASGEEGLLGDIVSVAGIVQAFLRARQSVNRRQAMAVRRLQRVAKGWADRVQLKKEDRWVAARTIQSWYRVTSTARRQRRELAKGRTARHAQIARDEAAGYIQGCIRGRAARSRMKALLALRHEEWERGREEMLAIDSMMCERAATKLQTLWRGYASKRAVAALRRAHFVELRNQLAWDIHRQGIEDEAATAIGSWYRMVIARRLYCVAHEERIREKAWLIVDDAAVAIQAVARGFLIREAVREARHQDQAVVQLQRVALGYRDRLLMQGRFQSRRRTVAAIRLQCWVRCLLAVRRVEARGREVLARDAHQLLEVSACVIQRVVRGRQERKRVERLKAENAKRKRAVEIIQAVVRSKHVRLWVVPPLAARRRAEIEDLIIGTAAVEVQRAVRGFLARRLAAKLRERRHTAARNIQRVYRGMVGRRIAAMARAAYMEEVHGARREVAASTIQTSWRRAKAVERERHERYLKREEEKAKRFRQRCIVLLQSVMRGWKARRVVGDRRETVVPRVLTIQASFRGYATRRCVRPLITERRRARAAAKVQRAWRLSRPRLQQLAEERDLLRKHRRMKLQGVLRDERASRCSISLTREEDMATFRAEFLAARPVRDKMQEFKDHLTAAPPQQLHEAAQHIQGLVRGRRGRVEHRQIREASEKKETSEPRVSRSLPDHVAAEERLRAEDEARYERVRLGEFSSLSTAPKGVAGMMEPIGDNHLLYPVRYDRRRHLKLICEESSLRAELELVAMCGLESLYQRFEQRPTCFVGRWKARPITPLPPLKDRGVSEVETIQLRLGDSVHNAPSPFVAAAFGEPHPRQPLPRVMGRVTFSDAPDGSSYSAAANAIEGAESLRRQVALNDPMVTSVILRGLPLTDAEVRPLLAALRHNTNVLHLDLSGTAIRDASAEELAHLAAVNATLVSIDVSHTAISDIGATNLLAALHRNPSLRVLNVDGTLITSSLRGVLKDRVSMQGFAKRVARPSDLLSKPVRRTYDRSAEARATMLQSLAASGVAVSKA